MAALDTTLRERVMVELIALQDTLKTTFIYVTHGNCQALTVADQMTIMNYGREIEQIGTPKEIYEFPASSFVAQFVLTTNIFEGTFKDSMLEVSGLGSFPLHVPQRKPWMIDGSHLSLSIRPKKIGISRSGTIGLFYDAFRSKSKRLSIMGRMHQYNVRLKMYPRACL